jgi:spermidine synthase
VKAWVQLAECALPGGAKLSLHEHDGQFSLRVAGRQLMSTRATGSEQRMAELACEQLTARPGARVLIGGLGLGFTLRRVLELAPPDARVEVAELMPQVVAWNREHLQGVNGRLLDDPRVTVLAGDVVAILAGAEPERWDAVLLDVDNGADDALVDRHNQRLYRAEGLRAVARALRPAGRAVFWSASTDRAFLRRLTQAGFRAEALGAKAYAAAKRDTHTLFVADRRG